MASSDKDKLAMAIRFEELYPAVFKDIELLIKSDASLLQINSRVREAAHLDLMASMDITRALVGVLKGDR